MMLRAKDKQEQKQEQGKDALPQWLDGQESASGVYHSVKQSVGREDRGISNICLMTI